MAKKIGTAVDLFCGCGGISVGLRLAGFEVLAGVDMESSYLSTFRHNFGDAKALNIDLAQLDPQDFMRSLSLRRGELDLLAGGPPCQGFSKNVPRKARFSEDPRNMLVQRFLDYCQELLPRTILMENVAEMKNGFEQAYTEEVLNRLKQVGYSVEYAVLNAADYGVPQRRRRAFFVANRVGIKFRFPDETHSKPSGIKGLFSLPEHISVWDAIGDLPHLEHGQGAEVCDYKCAPFSDFQRAMRADRESVANHLARKLQPTQYERLNSLKPGQGLKDLPAHLKTKGGYSGAYGRLTKEMIAPTITRWVFHPGSGRWGHPEDIRTLTMREVARVQSFPDSYEFVGTFNEQAGQLGNAVPPLLVKQVAQCIADQTGLGISSSKAINASTESFLSFVGRSKVKA